MTQMLQLAWIVLGILAITMLIRGIMALVLGSYFVMYTATKLSWLSREILSFLMFLGFFYFPYYWDSLASSPTASYFLGIVLGGNHASEGNMALWSACMKITVIAFAVLILAMSIYHVVVSAKDGQHDSLSTIQQ
jgi:hypothetical protein